MADNSSPKGAHPEPPTAGVCNGCRREDGTNSVEFSPSLDSDSTKKIGKSLIVLQLNVEGISKDKSDYLAKLCFEKKVDVVILQETHTSDDGKLLSRGNINGYILAKSLNSAVYGCATYIREGITDFKEICCSVISDIFVIVIEVLGMKICNIYKPPNSVWPENFPMHYDHPVIYAGDFNCHHNLWGYDTNDRNGVFLNNWIEMHNLQLHYDAKDRKSFHSARWRKDYNPDLCLTSKDGESSPIDIKREVLMGFPHSQHRPILIKTGTLIQPADSLKKPRWNFSKANWQRFKSEVDKLLRFVPANVDNYNRFVGIIKGAAKRTIPRGFRKTYIPCWSNELENLYKDYQVEPKTETADRILNSLNNSRKKKWSELVENMNFTHSSRSSWSLLKKLGETNHQNQQTSEISANSVASHLVNVSNLVILPRNIMKNMRRLLKKQRKSPASEELSRPFDIEELMAAIKMMKTRKAAGFDGIYPEFIKNLGNFSLQWLLSFLNSILISGDLPKDFKKSKIITILKPGKPADVPSSYRPIALLSVCYKLLERLLHKRIQPFIEDHLPKEQAGFRLNRNCCDQVLALTTHIEKGFQQKLKTGVAFLDLTSAYDTVWKDGLIHKLYNTIPCGKTVKLIDNMLSDRRFRVFVGEKSSKFRTLNNGLPQGSVLSPILFNLYTSDLPLTESRKFIYADDMALTFQNKSIEIIENKLSTDLDIMNNYFKNWRLSLNPSKTEVSCFHLDNHQKKKTLNITLNNKTLKHNFNPTYLGVTLDTSLLYREHLEKMKQKLKTRNNIIYKLAGTTWGANANTLRTSALALVYSTAEYCCPVWKNSNHVSKVDTQLNTTMRIITGTISSTPTVWLPVLSNIVPANIRRNYVTKKAWDKYHNSPDQFPIMQDLNNLEMNRLKSRKPLWLESFLDSPFKPKDDWRLFWQNNKNTLFNQNLIVDPTEKVKGFDLPRRVWSTINRLRTGHGRCNYMLHKWNPLINPSCICGCPAETITHIVTECPRTILDGGFQAIHQVSSEVREWINNLKQL